MAEGAQLLEEGPGGRVGPGGLEEGGVGTRAGGSRSSRGDGWRGSRC